MGKGAFDQSFEDMLEFDKSLDINDMLDSIPAIEKEELPKTGEPVEEEDKPKEKAKEPELNINKVLEEQTDKIEDVKKESKKVVDKVDEPDDETPATNEQTTETSSDAPFTVIFAKDLVQQGLISSFDEEKFADETKTLGEATALRNLIRDEIEANIDAAKQDLDLGYKEYLSLIGKGVPVETASSLVDLKNQFDAIKSDELVKEENVELRKKVMVDYFKLTTSMSDAKIEKLVQSSIDLGDDIDDSKEYLATLKNAVAEQLASEEEEAKKRNALRVEENRRTFETLKDTINSLDEIIPGLGINKQTKNKMYDIITKEVQDSKGRLTNAIWAKRAEDPINFDARLAYLLETGFFEKGKPWTKAGQAKVTKEISALEEAINSKKNTITAQGVPVILNLEQDKAVKDNIESMRGVFGK